MSSVIDTPNVDVLECNEYGVGFFFCILVENSNHRGDKFRISIMVYTINSDAWTDNFMKFLSNHDIKCNKVSLNSSIGFLMANFDWSL